MLITKGKLGLKHCRIPGSILAHITRVNVKASSINRKSSLSINCTLLKIMCGIELSFIKSMSSTLQPRDSKELTVLELSVLLLNHFVHVSSCNNFEPSENVILSFVTGKVLMIRSTICGFSYSSSLFSPLDPGYRDPQ